MAIRTSWRVSQAIPRSYDGNCIPLRPVALPSALNVRLTIFQARNQQYVVKDAAAAENLGKKFLFTNLAR